MTNQLCQIMEKSNLIELISPSFSFILDPEDLSAKRIENRLCNQVISFARGIEFSADFDQADGRITIDGWKVKDGKDENEAPDTEEGYLNGYYQCNFNDSSWNGCQSPVMFEDFKFAKNRFKWARTHVFLPQKFEGKKVTFAIGGIGLLDFGFCRLFINGREIAVRMVETRWHEIGHFVLDRTDDKYSCLNFGFDNIIAVQLTHYLCRDQKIDRFDPQKGRELATIGRSWPGQFEQNIIFGQPLWTPKWRVMRRKEYVEGETAKIDFALDSDSGNLSAVISYRWNSIAPVLHKHISITNHSGQQIRLMNIKLGEYQAEMDLTDGEQGFPVYINDCFYISVAHPSGWAMGQSDRIVLMQYPGVPLKPDETYQGMETVFGFSQPQKARDTFKQYIESHMRRVRRGHDRAIATFDSFGSWPIRPLELDYGHFPDEQAILHNIDRFAEGQIQDGCHFDYYTIEFWNDYYGDFMRPGSERFPNGLVEIEQKLERLGTGLGLWIDTSAGRWSIGGNPVIKNCRTYNSSAFKSDDQVMLLDECYCRAADPYKTMLLNGLIEHIRKNNVRLIKFDDAMAVCHNPYHDHLPGIYSIEAIQNSEIDMLKALDRESPDLFIVLYWGHRSPWWLLYADTIFESGLFLEASTPASFPTLYARDGVTVSLDQANQWRDDIPLSGRDSLGVWLSEWAWNSSIGNEHWQGSAIMDLCRGSRIFQFWSDYNWLSSAERKQAALFLDLLKQNEDCFCHSRLIIGSPWQNEPYGYCCSSGEHAFIAINNCSFSDFEAKLELSDLWDLANGMIWDIYQWYPEKKQYNGQYSVNNLAVIALRPFEVILLEAVAAGKKPSLNHAFKTMPIVSRFSEGTDRLELFNRSLPETAALKVTLDDFIDVSDKIRINSDQNNHQWTDTPRRITEKPQTAEYGSCERRVFQITTDIASCSKSGILYFAVKMNKDKALFKLNNVGMHFSALAKLDSQEIHCQPVIGVLTYAVPWQGWRITMPESSGKKRVEITLTALLPKYVTLDYEGYFIPGTST